MKGLARVLCTISVLASMAVACQGESKTKTSATTATPAAGPLVQPATASIPADTIDHGTEQFPMSVLLASLNQGLPPATLQVADTTCIPGRCTCRGDFPYDWMLTTSSSADSVEVARGTTCLVADFDGDTDWDANFPGGEGKSVTVLMQNGQPFATWYIDGGAVAEVYAPRAKSGPNGEPATRNYALRDLGDLDRYVLYEWRDTLFVRRTVQKP